LCNTATILQEEKVQLFTGMATDFMRAATRNQIAGMLKDAFFAYYRYEPGDAEVRSWQNSLRATADVFDDAGLTDHGVLLEFQLPLTSRRLDCLVCGRDQTAQDNAVLIELKQWDRCSEAHGEDLVCTWVGGGQRDVLHPSVQVHQYHQYLADTHTAFHEGNSPILLDSCAYLHNYQPEQDDHLFAPKFEQILSTTPAFTADDFDKISGLLRERLETGQGGEVLERIAQSSYRPSKKLMDHVAGMIHGNPAYVLLDEQLVVYRKVMAFAESGMSDRRKTVVIIRGGPGTGKSVIALNIMASLLEKGRNAHYATGSKAFTETLRKVVGSRGSAQFKYFNSYAQAAPSEIDVLIADEAHRIRQTSNNRFTPKAKQSNKPQIQEIIDASRIGVFFIDDRQVVRPNEIGSSELIRTHAENNDCRLQEFKLEAQFRCAGSDGFVRWLENTLGLARTANVLWDGTESFDFRIFDSPLSLDNAIRDKVEEGFTGRMSAGFCWPWSKPKSDGTLEDDVRVGEYCRPWNAKSGAGRLARGIPKETLWAHQPEGIDQVGCIYTAQGFEFDYVGVIWGPDLRYSFEESNWIGDREQSHDTIVKRSGDRFADLVKNTYRVLLSRGLKGCYVHFMDKDTERFIRTRMEVDSSRSTGE
jgi:uncharacterized protein